MKKQLLLSTASLNRATSIRRSLLKTAFLISGFLVLAVTSLAGTWSYNYAGGSMSGETGYGDYTPGWINPFIWDGAASGGGYSYSATGPTSVTCTYTPGLGELPIPTATLTIQVQAYWSGPVGSANDGWNDAEVSLGGGYPNFFKRSSRTFSAVISSSTDSFTYEFESATIHHLASSSGNSLTGVGMNEGAGVRVTVTPSP